jgi:hypothetical protein
MPVTRCKTEAIWRLHWSTRRSWYLIVSSSAWFHFVLSKSGAVLLAWERRVGRFSSHGILARVQNSYTVVMPSILKNITVLSTTGLRIVPAGHLKFLKEHRPCRTKRINCEGAHTYKNSASRRDFLRVCESSSPKISVHAYLTRHEAGSHVSTIVKHKGL